MNGPALDARGKRVVAAWFTEGGGGPEMRTALSMDGGRSFGKPTTLPAEDPIGRCGAAVLSDGSSVVCWMELVDNAAEVHVSRNGKKAVHVAKTAAGRSSGVPEIVADGEGVIVAWRDVSKRCVLTARVTW